MTIPRDLSTPENREYWARLDATASEAERQRQTLPAPSPAPLKPGDRVRVRESARSWPFHKFGDDIGTVRRRILVARTGERGRDDEGVVEVEFPSGERAQAHFSNFEPAPSAALPALRERLLKAIDDIDGMSTRACHDLSLSNRSATMLLTAAVEKSLRALREAANALPIAHLGGRETP